MNWGATGVTVRFGRRTALKEVTFHAVQGEVRCVVGGDGAGKTTLLRAIAGALRPDAGEVVRPRAEEIGYMPASSGVYPDLSVDENLSFVAAAYGLPHEALMERSGDLLGRMGLDRARARLGSELSGGMRQKLGVLMAMLHRPRLLILDEPTTGVDPVSRSDLWWLIARAAAEGAAVALATSYLDEAERAAELLVLEGGRPVAVGTPDAITAAMPGTLALAERRPVGDAALRSWRRGRTWRVWQPQGEGETPGYAIRPDLQDAVTAAILRGDLEDAAQGGVGR